MNSKTPLNSGWTIQGYTSAGFDAAACLSGVLQPQYGPYKAEMPCDVHTVLLREGVIEDPAFGANDVKCAWVEGMVWVYRRALSLTAEELACPLAEVRFEGLDIYADVYLNGALCAASENMFVPCTLDLRGGAKPGANQLAVVFHPVRQRAAKPLPEGFWTNYSTERAWARKPGYQFGWDWTPRLVTAGIWLPVYAVVADVPVVDGLQVHTLALENNNSLAQIECRAQIRGGPEGCEALVQVLDGNTVVAEHPLARGQARFALENPKLWWTHELGGAHLYTARVVVLQGGRVVAQAARLFGVRTVEMQLKDETGAPCFVTRLNGRPLFLRGANWVPAGNRPAALVDGDYTRALARARKAGMNAINLWGGGLYEKDAFYEYCDANGILVWQYFMFACGEYPDFDEGFVQSVAREVRHQVRRLSTHPCIAIWVGNVEQQMIAEKIGLDHTPGGTRLFHKLIPEWLAELDPTRFYMPTSPYFGEYANSPLEGDTHNWDLWFGDYPYTAYGDDMTTFASEFGLHASPARCTVEKYCGKDVTMDSFAFQYFNRDQSLDRMAYYFSRHTGQPKDLDQYIDYSMLVQAEAMQLACGHYRRRYPACGGAMIWQLNDCCGVQGWSLVDYDDIPKASWYYARQFFAPVAISAKAVDGAVTEIWAHNDTANARKIRVEITVGDFLGTVAHCETLEATVEPGRPVLLRRLAAGGRYAPNVVLHNRPRLFFLAARLQGAPRPLLRFFAEHKDLPLPPAGLEVAWKDGTATLATQNLARFVKLDGDLAGLEVEDNYFDLLPGEGRTIAVRVKHGPPLTERSLFWKALNGDAVYMRK